MERNEKTSITRKLPELLLYRDEIDSIYEYLGEECAGPIELLTAGFKLDSPDEVVGLKVDEASDIIFSCYDPNLKLKIYSAYGEIWVMDTSSRGRGIAASLEEKLEPAVLTPGRIRKLEKSLWFVIPFLFIISCVIYGLLPGRDSVLSGELAFHDWTLIVPIWTLLMTLYGGVGFFISNPGNNKKSVVKFIYRNERASFLKRNRDKILLGTFFTILGVLLALIGQWVMAYFQKPPS